VINENKIETFSNYLTKSQIQKKVQNKNPFSISVNENLNKITRDKENIFFRSPFTKNDLDFYLEPNIIVVDKSLVKYSEKSTNTSNIKETSEIQDSINLEIDCMLKELNNFVEQTKKEDLLTKRRISFEIDKLINELNSVEKTNYSLEIDHMMDEMNTL